MLWLNCGLGSGLEKSLNILVPERLDHAYSVTHHDTQQELLWSLSIGGHLSTVNPGDSYELFERSTRIVFSFAARTCFNCAVMARFNMAISTISTIMANMQTREPEDL